MLHEDVLLPAEDAQRPDGVRAKRNWKKSFWRHIRVAEEPCSITSLCMSKGGSGKRDGSSVPLSQSIRSQRIEALSQVNGWQRLKNSACMLEYVCMCTHMFTCTEKLKQVRPTPSLCWIGTVEMEGWKGRWENSGVWKVEVIWPQRRCTWERGGAIIRWNTARGPNILWGSFLLCSCPEDWRLSLQKYMKISTFEWPHFLVLIKSVNMNRWHLIYCVQKCNSCRINGVYLHLHDSYLHDTVTENPETIYHKENFDFYLAYNN